MVSISDTMGLLLTLERPSTLKDDAKEVQCTVQALVCDDLGVENRLI